MDQVHALRRWREEKGVTLAALAGTVGVTASHLSEIERWLDRPSLRLASKLSLATAPADAPESPAVPLSEFVEIAEAAE